MTTTSPPSAATRFAAAAPIPVAPPTTSTRLPSYRNGSVVVIGRGFLWSSPGSQHAAGHRQDLALVLGEIHLGGHVEAEPRDLGEMEHRDRAHQAHEAMGADPRRELARRDALVDHGPEPLDRGAGSGDE